MTEPLLTVRDLHTHFHFDGGRVLKAVDGVSLTVQRGGVVGLVGESGSGKSLTALSIIRLLDARARIVGGEIIFNGQDLRRLSDREMHRLRGRHISMVLQDPLTALNPIMSIGRHLENVIAAHRPLKRHALRDEAVRLLGLVRLPDPEHLLGIHSHELSGGMRQRVVIAMAIASGAELLIADEPTTALDVTTQLQILALFNELRASTQLSMLFISHDLGVIAHICDQVCVMLRGRIVERAPTATLLQRPLHSYTQRLLASIPGPQHKGGLLGVTGATNGVGASAPNERLVEVEPGHEVALPAEA